MDSFFDTNVIFKYSLYGSESEHKLLKKCFDCIDLKKGKFIICYRVLRELESLRKRYRLIYLEALKKILSKDYKIGSSPKTEDWFQKKDFPMAMRVYLKNKNKRVEQIKKEFNEIITQMNLRLNFFREKLVDSLIIREEEIDKRIVSLLHEFIDNHTDCEILTSAILFQNSRELFLFVTADRDFAPNDYDFIKEDDRFKDYTFPVLKNLLFD